jgi:hypothetical protein
MTTYKETDPTIFHADQFKQCWRSLGGKPIAKALFVTVLLVVASGFAMMLITGNVLWSVLCFFMFVFLE